MGGPHNNRAKWQFLSAIDADVAILQETQLPANMSGHSSRRRVRPASDRDDVVIVTKEPSIVRQLPSNAYGQGLEVEYNGIRIFGIRSYLQLKEYYPKALLRILEAVAESIKNNVNMPAIITGDFNASLDQGPGRDWTPPFRYLHDLGFYDALCVKNRCSERSLPCAQNHGKTFRNAHGEYRIDHVYLNRALISRLNEIAIIERGWSLSDHRPLVATISP